VDGHCDPGLSLLLLGGPWVHQTVTFQIKQWDFFQILWRGHEPQVSTLGI